jgi:hypothetical protein
MVGAIARVKHLIPFAPQVRWVKRALVGYGSDPANDEGLLEDAVLMAAAMMAAGARLDGARVVEIGTGWMPMLPLVFGMAGAHVVTMDLNRLMDQHTFRHSVHFVRAHLPAMLARHGINPALFPMARLIDVGRLESLKQMSARAGIVYRAPVDFFDLQPRACDHVVSRTVLEHIPDPVMPRLFAHTARVLKPGGMMCHLIALGDHFEFTDKSLSKVDFLRYSGREWAVRAAQPGCYQNRLRRFDYVRMLEQAGWRIVSATGTPDPKALADLKTMTIAAPYTHAPHEELAIVNAMIVAQHGAA